MHLIVLYPNAEQPSAYLSKAEVVSGVYNGPTHVLMSQVSLAPRSKNVSFYLQWLAMISPSQLVTGVQ